MTTTITKTLSGQWIEFEVERTNEGVRIVKETPIEAMQMNYYDGVIYKDLHSGTFDVFIGGWSIECQTLEEAKAYIRDFMGIDK